ncbi:4-(cytidine 5'-diphospho)-2-C-methyl-D-erythritol kinase [Planctobacterium marinum]|uniref:4-(cytidine 5'-diphospho)-2-C-methyl-D-erythritol kinase n=1 Tax=Planctobacterium marinum TaxID=1631968 RepID=UPI001E47207D|nr:4-(cytidine 5'-diphospho)-2-C-methyl-D-erythritol kinase [Planctobacterium marinum]MCC2604328.1 4-(cytidine 5'-diphospho)-2-C-methyl-D-erythritol kinase [Planctobacterium marinum]
MFLSRHWPSPAKLNLFLHITGRRSDGYHELQSLFQMLDVGDELHFNITDDPEILLLSHFPEVPHEQNLIVRAAKLLQTFCGVSKGCTIEVDKILPMGGGIGGGSSNAATTLVALNHLWRCNLTNQQLQHLGLQLGADVPVFINGKTTFATGVGEQFQAAPETQQTFLVVNPGVHVSTAEVFTDPELPRNSALLDTAHYRFEDTRNDCQALVCKKHPVIANTLQWLLQYAPSRMTGTGASIFGVFNHPEDAQKALHDLPEHCSGFVAQGCVESPLHKRLSQELPEF